MVSPSVFLSLSLSIYIYIRACCSWWVHLVTHVPASSAVVPVSIKDCVSCRPTKNPVSALGRRCSHICMIHFAGWPVAASSAFRGSELTSSNPLGYDWIFLEDDWDWENDWYANVEVNSLMFNTNTWHSMKWLVNDGILKFHGLAWFIGIFTSWIMKCTPWNQPSIWKTYTTKRKHIILFNEGAKILLKFQNLS